MHVALLIGHFPPGSYGGAELQAEGWARRLAVRHRVTVVTRADDARLAGRESRDGFTVVRLPVSRWPLWRTWSDLRAIERTVRGLEPRPDVLLCFQTFVSGWAGTRAARRLGIPALVWIRGEAEYRLGDSRFLRWLSPRVWSRAGGVLVQSEANRADLFAELRRHAPAVADRLEGRVAVVGNGLELPPLRPRSAGGPFLTVGRLIADKGMDLAIRACATIGRPLVIAGAGPERAALEAEARAHGADVRFAGRLDRDALARVYDEASAVVLAARRGEGLPNVLLEAMAHGRPVVATPCAGTRDLLMDGGNGLLVHAGDEVALARALGRLDAEPELAARLATAARATAERFEWSRVEPLLEAVLTRGVGR